MDKIDLATGVPNQQFTATLGGNRYEIRIVNLCFLMPTKK
jgi:hypothetical protein